MNSDPIKYLSSFLKQNNAQKNKKQLTVVKVNIKVQKTQSISLDMFNTDTWTLHANQVVGKAICYRDW